MDNQATECDDDVRVMLNKLVPDFMAWVSDQTREVVTFPDRVRDAAVEVFVRGLQAACSGMSEAAQKEMLDKTNMFLMHATLTVLIDIGIWLKTADLVTYRPSDQLLH